MSNTIWAKARYAFRSDSTENWKKINPVLLAGEHGVVTDSTIPHQREKIGDGKTPWNDLGWFHGPEGKGSTVDQTYNNSSENAQSGVAVNEAIFYHNYSNIAHEDIRKELSSIKFSLSGKLTREIVEELPDIADGKENVIYMVPNKEAKENNIYDEYMIVSDNANAVTHYSQMPVGLVTDVNSGDPITNTVITNAVCSSREETYPDVMYTFTGQTPEGESVTIQIYVDNDSFNATDFDNATVDFYIGGTAISLDATVYLTNVQKSFEPIGSTAVDLSGYATEESVDEKISSAIGEALEGDY